MRTFQLLVLGLAALASASVIPVRSPQYISGRQARQVQIEPLRPGTYPITPPDVPTLPVVEPAQPEVELNPIAGHKIPTSDSFLGVEPIYEPEVVITPSIGKPGVYPIKPPQDPTLPVEALPGDVIVSPVVGVYPIIPDDPTLPVEALPGEVVVSPVFGVYPILTNDPTLPVEALPGDVIVNPVGGHKIPGSDPFLGVEPNNEPEVVITPTLPGTYPIFPPAEPSLGVEPEQEHNVVINPIPGVYPIVYPQDPTLPVESQPGYVIVSPIANKPGAGVYPIFVPAEPTLPVESQPGYVIITPVAGHKVPTEDSFLGVEPIYEPEVVITPSIGKPGVYPIKPPQDPTLPVEALPGDVVVSPVVGVYPVIPNDPTLPVEALPGDVIVSPVVGVYPILPNDPTLPVEALPGDVIVNPVGGHKIPGSDPFLGVEPVHEPEVVVTPNNPGVYPIIVPSNPTLQVLPILH